MDSSVVSPLAKARALVVEFAPELVEKTIWGSPAGKKRLGKSRGKRFSRSTAGIEANTAARVAKFAPRLKHVQVFSGDYEPVVRKFDGKDTLHFLDPPYAGYNVAVGEGKFDEERFFKLVKG